MCIVQSVQLLKFIPNDIVKTANTDVFSYLSLPLVCYLNAPLSPKFNVTNHPQEIGRCVRKEGRRGKGKQAVASTPCWKENNVLGMDSFPLGLGSAWGHFSMFAKTI